MRDGKPNASCLDCGGLGFLPFDANPLFGAQSMPCICTRRPNRYVAAARARLARAAPTRRLVIITSSRLIIGGSALALSAALPGLLERLAHYGGVMFLMLAAYGVLGHVETHMMDAIVRAIEVVTGRAGPNKTI